MRLRRRHIRWRKLLRWTPLIGMLCMLIIQSTMEPHPYQQRSQSRLSFDLVNVFSHTCPRGGEDLVGRMNVPESVPFEQLSMRYSEEQILKSLPNPLDEGGSWSPKHCRPNYHVAVIIPFRQRHDQLPVLLFHLHPILQRQYLNYKIFVAEQWGTTAFNKALMMNIAFSIIRDQFPDYDCFIFHDVDLLPEDDRNRYRCGRFPRHLSAAVNEFNYKLPYSQIAGGVLAMTSDQFMRVNGYSNMYWGWGGEDDDMYYRIKASGMLLLRPSLTIARYTMLRHQKRTPWNESKQLLVRALTRFHRDGIAQLDTIPYKILHLHPRLLYTHILIDVPEQPRSTPSADTEQSKNDYRDDLEIILDQLRGSD